MKLTIKKDAVEFRKELGYGNTDALNLTNVLIKLNIITVFKRLSDGFSGMALSSGDRKFILINSAHSRGRQNFSICHELFHLYKDDVFKPHHSYAGSFNRKSNEFLADTFASYFLLPDDGVLSLIPDTELIKDHIEISTILKIEHFFGCSRNALLYRLKEMDLISKASYDKYNQSIIKTARLNGYTTELYEPGNDGKVIGDYGPLAKSLYDQEKISESHYQGLMNDIGIDIFNNIYDEDQDR